MRVWGDPHEFKGVSIYPITMQDCMDFYECVQVFLYEKNKVQDIQVIKMTYLDFLFALIQQENALMGKLDRLLSLVLKEQKYAFLYNETDSAKISLQVEDAIINGYEFDEFKKIILEQNLIQFNEEFIDPELEQELKAAEEFLAKKNGTPATLEERVVALHCLSGVSYQEIKNYTIFQFNKTLERFAIIKNFDVYSALLAENGASKDIQHWLSHVEEKGKYDDVIMSKEEFDKITSDKDMFKA
ncbi:hypothetical protein [Paenibacillus cremeus]|uniref:Uncharacterized protein n=1 Tax=Paenibacillus cremeus TaxID=2163881 RepID=A0A559KCZ9_9BACL|nr:hypothetical protein [Paenibacillus cremeus]TVY09969.1 hypothetical protein FPZ49_11400 [Paenibacillus cremeus]